MFDVDFATLKFVYTRTFQFAPAEIATKIGTYLLILKSLFPDLMRISNFFCEHTS